MAIDRTILRSKVARRIFLLFVACAMVPIVVLTVMSSQVLGSRLDEEARLRVRRASKSVGMAILGRLSLVESDLRTLALSADLDPAARTGPAWERRVDHWKNRVRGIARIGPSGLDPWFGPELPAAAALDLVRSEDRPGEARLSWLADDRAPPRLLLSLAIEAALGRSVLVAEIDPDYLWEAQGELDLPWNVEFLVLDAEDRPIFTTFAEPEARTRSIRQDTAGTANGEFRWRSKGRDHRGHAWPLFLKAQFGSPAWTVVLVEAADGDAGALIWASEILPLAILLCLLIVGLLSLSQIRKSLVPIITLQAGTRQVAASNFDARVKVDSNDEFSQLADSFNAMAERLGTQFRTLATLAEIDRELLSTLSEQQIVQTLLLRAPDRFGCDRAAVSLVGSAGCEGLSTRSLSDGGACQERLAVLSAEERDLLFGGGDGPLRLSKESLPPHLTDVLGDDAAECLVVPIRKNSICGCLILGFQAAEACTDETLTEARRLADQAGVALSNARLVEELERVNWETLYALARAVDANSPWTSGHSERVTNLAMELARRLRVNEKDLGVLHRGGLLHDIGKIGVPSPILDKPGRLTDEEFASMRDHVRIGARILEPITAYRRETDIVLYHHERWDGKGYPHGLAGREIPFLARVLAVADVFDALVSDRPYRAGWELSRVVEFIGSAAGTQFDRDVVAAFLDIFESGTWPDHVRGVEPCLTSGVGTCDSPRPA